MYLVMIHKYLNVLLIAYKGVIEMKNLLNKEVSHKNFGGRKGLNLFVAVIIATFVVINSAYAVPSISLTAISTPFPTPIGIDHYAPNNTLIMTQHYPSGAGGNFVEVAADGTQSTFSSVSGLTNEIKIATVRSGNVGGFTTGDLFTGNGIDGQILKLSAGGTTVINP